MIIIPILSIFGFSSFFAKYFKTKLTFAIPVTISILVPILYCFAMLKLLLAATYVSYFIGIFLAFVSFLCFMSSLPFTSFLPFMSFFRKQESRKNIIEIIVFTLLILLFFLYTRDASLHAYDDFSHWGIFTKELLYFGVFENQSSLTSIITTHAHYPRGAAVYHYFILSLSGYSDGNVLFAHFLLHLAFLVPLAANKKLWQTGVLFSLILCSVVLYTTGIRSIYNDSTIGLMFGAIVAIYILEEDKKKALLLILPITILLASFREIGTWFASFASVILIAHYTIFYKKPKKSSDYITYLILLTLPILYNFIWMHYFKNTHDFFDRGEHSFSNLVYIAENFNEQHRLLLLNYGKFLLLFLVKEGSLVVYTICIAAWYGIHKYKPDLLKEYKFFLISTFACFIIFALWRLYLYFFNFSYEEAIRGASLLRYLGCYIISIGMIAAAYVKNSIFLNRSLQKRGFREEFEGDTEHSTAVYTNVREDSSTGSTYKLPLEVECPKSIKQSNKELFIFLLLLAVSTFSVVKNILRIKHLNLEQKNFIQQTTEIKKLLKQGNKIEFNFSGKKDNLQCYILNYNIAPYLGKKYLQECIKTPKEAMIETKEEAVYAPFLGIQY
ncbi:MAG: PMT-2 domain-containing protein [Rickettsia helvetica]|uniref:PMT-2 domain-containing protein n=2 Tax=Rickettsia helvetica TaxID=35789 RepID=A0ABM9ND01_RICHE|nr:palindromic element RPE1 domain-containing protein [Rickettsia helvetica]